MNNIFYLEVCLLVGNRCTTVNTALSHAWRCDLIILGIESVLHYQLIQCFDLLHKLMHKLKWGGGKPFGRNLLAATGFISG